MDSTDLTEAHVDEVQEDLAAAVWRSRHRTLEHSFIDRCPIHGVWRFEGVCDLCDE